MAVALHKPKGILFHWYNPNSHANLVNGDVFRLGTQPVSLKIGCYFQIDTQKIPNEYSENILITDSDFILSDRTSAICITADMSFKSRLEADFKREYQNVEFLFRQRPGLGGMAALPPSVAQVPGKYLCFLVTRVNDRNTIDPEHVIMALTRLRDFMIEIGITEVSMPVYDPNRGKLSPRELYAILHVVFAET